MCLCVCVCVCVCVCCVCAGAGDREGVAYQGVDVDDGTETVDIMD